MSEYTPVKEAAKRIRKILKGNVNGKGLSVKIGSGTVYSYIYISGSNDGDFTEDEKTLLNAYDMLHGVNFCTICPEGRMNTIDRIERIGVL